MCCAVCNCTGQLYLIVLVIVIICTGQITSDSHCEQKCTDKPPSTDRISLLHEVLSRGAGNSSLFIPHWWSYSRSLTHTHTHRGRTWCQGSAWCTVSLTPCAPKLKQIIHRQAAEQSRTASMSDQQHKLIRGRTLFTQPPVSVSLSVCLQLLKLSGVRSEYLQENQENQEKPDSRVPHWICSLCLCLFLYLPHVIIASAEN